MAIKIYEKYAPRANPGDGNYPNGSIKNESVPGANDGTPLDKDWGNDMVGFGDALLNAGGVTPSGLPDTVLASDRLTALTTIVREQLYGIDKGSVLKKKLEQRFDNATVVDFAVEYLTQAEIDEININYPVGALETKPTLDITAKLIQAIADLGGSHDISTAYLYEPAKILQLPSGAMGLDLTGLERVLIGVNNINIVGTGMFNTRICHIGTSSAQEMFRFKEAYACGLAHLTLDGGLPFNPVGTETNGADIPLVTDQCAHFYSEGLNIVNYRLRGWQATHLWESFLGNDLRIQNGGWFALGAAEPGGLMFDEYLQESTFFPGSESNQIYIGKYAFGGIGRVLHCKSPVFNLQIGQIVSEGRTLGSYIPPQFGVSKIFVSGISAGIVVKQAWHYYHDQPNGIGVGGTLFDLFNAGPGCKFENQVIYQEIPGSAPTNILEVDKLINNTSAHSVHLELNIEDRNATTTLFTSAPNGSLIKGEITYRKDVVRNIDDFMGATGASNFVGDVTMSTGGFTTTPPIVYRFDGMAVVLSAISGGDSFVALPARAFSNFNGYAPGAGGGARSESGISTVRVSVGRYKCTYTKAMPDANSSVNITLGAEGYIEWVTRGNGFFEFLAKNAAGLKDFPYIDISVFR